MILDGKMGSVGEGCTERRWGAWGGVYGEWYGSLSGLLLQVCVWLDAEVTGGGVVASYVEFKGLFSVAVEDFLQEKTDINKVLHTHIGVNYNLFYGLFLVLNCSVGFLKSLGDRTE